MLEKKWDYYLNNDHSKDINEQNKLSGEDEAKACVNNPVNINKTLVANCTVKVTGKPDIAEYQCPFVWNIQDEKLANSIRIGTLDGIYFYYELYNGSSRVYGSGDIEWLIDGSPVDNNILFEMKKDHVGKTLSVKFTQIYNGHRQEPLTVEYGILKNALSKASLRYTGDFIKQGDKIDVSQITAYECYDCFNQKIPDISFTITSTNDVPLEQLFFDYSNYHSVSIQNDNYFKFTTKLYIPVKAAFKYEFNGIQFNQLPELSEDKNNINYGKIKFNNVTTNKILYRFENEKEWKNLSDSEIAAKEGDKLLFNWN